jgi:hypothetical protein
MPLFYFSLRNGNNMQDEEGTDLPDLGAVRHHAFQVAGELWKGKKQDLGLNWTLVVTDDQGRTVFTLPMGDEEPKPSPSLGQNVKSPGGS